MKTTIDRRQSLFTALLLLPFAVWSHGSIAFGAEPPPPQDEPHLGARLMITAPRDNAVFQAPASFQVSAIGLGRYGGVTDTELLLDDKVVGESHIRFIRAPEPDEPVTHTFDVADIGPGRHTLVVREAGESKLVSGPVAIEVKEGPAEPQESIRILSPLPDTLFSPDETIKVEALAVGRLGGITHVELLVDGAPAGESEIVFIRAPGPDEPVFHQFELKPAPPLGSHRLTVREVGNPRLESAPVPISVVVTLQPAAPSLLRLTSLADGVLMLVLKAEETGVPVEIQASSDLVNWEPVGSGKSALRTPIAGSTFAAPPSGTRFYRAVPAGSSGGN